MVGRESGGRGWAGDGLEGEGTGLWIRVRGMRGFALDEKDVFVVWWEVYL